MSARRPLVLVLFTSVPPARASLGALAERLGPDTDLHVVSWLRSDVPVQDVVASHVVLDPEHRGRTTSVRGFPPVPSAPPATVPSAVAPAAPAALRGAPDPAVAVRGPSSARARLGHLHWGTRRALVRRGRDLRARARALPDSPGPVGTGTRAARRVVLGGLSRRLSWRAWRDPAVRRLLEQADVVVAMDVGAVRTAWQVGRRRTDAHVVYGADAALRALRPRPTSWSTERTAPTNGAYGSGTSRSADAAAASRTRS